MNLRASINHFHVAREILPEGDDVILKLNETENDIPITNEVEEDDHNEQVKYIFIVDFSRIVLDTFITFPSTFLINSLLIVGTFSSKPGAEKVAVCKRTYTFRRIRHHQITSSEAQFTFSAAGDITSALTQGRNAVPVSYYFTKKSLRAENHSIH
jgi:hypothetical protein